MITRIAVCIPFVIKEFFWKKEEQDFLGTCISVWVSHFLFNVVITSTQLIFKTNAQALIAKACSSIRI